MALTKKNVLDELRSLSDPDAVKGMARFGISATNTLGVSVPNLRLIARKVGKEHKLAQDLWSSEIHEARILASMIDDPKLVDEKQMEEWVNEFDSWDVCDQCCGNLFDKTKFAYRKSVEWSGKDPEFVKRAGLIMMAELAVHDKTAPDKEFLKFLSIIEKSSDERNFVKKAINWALRQIGKRNLFLNKEAIVVATRMRKSESKASKWIASDALRELKSDPVQIKLRK
jgi:3-methyladenine DNA glycosylase AlkD